MKVGILALHLADKIHRLSAPAEWSSRNVQVDLSEIIEKEAIIPAKIETLRWVLAFLDSDLPPDVRRRDSICAAMSDISKQIDILIENSK